MNYQMLRSLCRRRSACAAQAATVAILIVVATAWAQEPPPGVSSGWGTRTSITGFPPYMLATDENATLASNPGFNRGSRVLWSSAVQTTAYSKKINAPIGGRNYPALLVLQFLQKKLGVVLISWSSEAFGSVGDWRSSGEDLYNQLKSAYSFDLVKEHLPPFRGAPMMHFQDLRGNRLQFFSSAERFTISLGYLWAPYASALDRAPTPRGNY